MGWDVAWVMLVCLIGGFVMRGAGCTWNDFTDRNYDAKVARTASRPLPSGQITPRQALIWLAIQGVVGLALLLTLNPTAILLGIASLATVAIYPFAKRFTWWPQIFLGLAFNWGALLGWAAIAGSLGWAPILLYASGIAWTLFYDTIYAHQDTEDDALIGVKSTARLFGEETPRYLLIFLVLAVGLMGASFIAAMLETANVLAMTIVLGGPWAFGWHLSWQMRRLDISDPQTCLSIFRSNRDAGFIPALFLAVGAFL